jgi:hypothetical protein
VHISSITEKNNLYPATKYSIHNYLTKHLMHNISLINKKTLTVPDTTRDKKKRTHTNRRKRQRIVITVITTIMMVERNGNAYTSE